MLRLKDLKLANIARFVTPQQIDFTQLGYFIQVDGWNKNTGGSSGSGKSSTFNALDYLLGLNDIPTTILQSRLTKEPISVTGIFDWDGIEVTVTRSKNKLTIEHSGKIIEGSNALAEEELDTIIGMDRELFRKTMHKRQDEGGFFLQMAPKQMYAFMSSCVNLKKEQEQLEKAGKNVLALEKEIESLANSILVDQGRLKTAQESIISLGMPPVKDIHKEVIIDLKRKYEASAKALQDMVQSHSEQNINLDRQKPILKENPVLEPIPQLPMPELEETILNNFDVISEKTQKINELNNQINILQQTRKDEKDQITAKIKEIQTKIAIKSHKCEIGIQAKTSAVSKAAEVKKIQAAICPTCEQTWVTETAKIKESSILEEIKKLKEQIQEGAIAEAEIAGLKKQLSELESTSVELTSKPIDGILDLKEQIRILSQEKEYEEKRAQTYNVESSQRNSEKIALHAAAQKKISDEVSARNNTLLDEVSVYNQRISNQYTLMVSSIREAQNQEKVQKQGQADVDRRALDSAITKLQTYEQNKSRYDDSLNKMKLAESTYLKELQEKEAQLLILEQNLEKAKELHLAIKTYLSVSFEEALGIISENATQIIRCIPNMSNATIQFESQKETQDGKIKEEINAVLSVDGEPNVPIKSLSGGERSATDLAIDLAVIDFIEMKSGKGIDLFILDEPFNGLGPIEIEMALAVLQNSNTNKRIVVVDHHSEVKEMVSDSILVVREGLTSIIESGKAE